MKTELNPHGAGAKPVNTIICPFCGRPIGRTYLARHLEKCSK